MTLGYHYDGLDAYSEDEVVERPEVALILGAGANTEHFGKALAGVREDGCEVHVTDIRPVDSGKVPHDELYLVNELEGRQRLRRTIESGVVKIVYISLVPGMHMGALEEYLRYAGEGLIQTVVVTKPAVEDITQMKAVDRMYESAKKARRDCFGEGTDEDFLYVHEHYVVKGAWTALRGQLGEVADTLGRLNGVSIDIQEARTVEEEGRALACAGGAFEDLGPHVTSLGLNIQDAVNTSNRYTISDRSRFSMERYRYDDSQLPAGVDTGFTVCCDAKITDEANGAEHDVPFVLRGGKGLADKKAVVLEFVHPDTQEVACITVDLQRNTLDVPEAVAHLFPQTQFTDNGYGDVVRVGLSGDNPGERFQEWREARTVTKLLHHIARTALGSMVGYVRNGQALGV
jgi:hypothetical protein